MPKILLINNRVPFPLKDGGAMANHKLISGLLEAKDVDLDLFFLNTRKHYLPFEETKVIYKKANNIYQKDISTEVSKLGAIKALLTNTSYNISRFYDKEIAQILAALCTKEKYDIIHFENLFVAPYAQELRHICEAKFVLRMHNVEFKIWDKLADEESNFIKKQYLKILSKQLKRFELKSLKWFHGFLPISKEDEVWLRSMTTQKSQVLPTAMKIDEDLSFSSGTNFFHIGSMEWQPNIKAVDWLLSKVWPLVIAQKPNYLLHLAGKGMNKKEYENSSQKSVIIHGEVPNAREFMLQNNTMIIPLQSASGLRIKALEAMLMKRPIISTSIGMSGVDFKNNINCMVADSAIEMANAIVLLGENEALQKKLAMNAHQYLKNNFAEELVNQQLLQFYKEIYQ